jgi:hypothetical protein
MTSEEIRKRLAELRDKQLQDMGRFSFALGEMAGEIKALESLAVELERASVSEPESKSASHINGEAREEI